MPLAIPRNNSFFMLLGHSPKHLGLIIDKTGFLDSKMGSLRPASRCWH
jgi:hypothetical protein